MRTLIIGILVGVPLALIVAAGQAPLRGAITSLFALLQSPFTVSGEGLRTVARWLAARISEAVLLDAVEGEAAHGHSPSRTWLGWPIVGALLYLAAFLAFTFAEFWLLVLTLGALFGFEAPEAPLSMELLAGFAFIGVAIFWGMVLLDIAGITSLGPWDRLTAQGRRVMLGVSVACVTLSLLVGGLLGIWRMEQLAAPVTELGDATVTAIQENPLTSRDGFAGLNDIGKDSGAHPDVSAIARIAGASLPVLVGASATVSGWGLAASLRYIWALVLAALVLPVGLVSTVLHLAAGLIDQAFALIDNALAFIGRIGRTLWNWLTRFHLVQETLRFKPLPEQPDSDLPNNGRAAPDIARGPQEAHVQLETASPVSTPAGSGDSSQDSAISVGTREDDDEDPEALLQNLDPFSVGRR